MAVPIQPKQVSTRTQLSDIEEVEQKTPDKARRAATPASPNSENPDVVSVGENDAAKKIAEHQKSGQDVERNLRSKLSGEDDPTRIGVRSRLDKSSQTVGGSSSHKS